MLNGDLVAALRYLNLVLCALGDSIVPRWVRNLDWREQWDFKLLDKHYIFPGLKRGRACPSHHSAVVSRQKVFHRRVDESPMLLLCALRWRLLHELVEAW